MGFELKDITLEHEHWTTTEGSPEETWDLNMIFKGTRGPKGHPGNVGKLPGVTRPFGKGESLALVIVRLQSFVDDLREIACAAEAVEALEQEED